MLLQQQLSQLPNLVHLDIPYCTNGQVLLFDTPSLVSRSLQHLSTSISCFRWSLLDQLLHTTTKLRSLRVHMMDPDTEDYTPSSSFPALVKLTIVVPTNSLLNFSRFLQSLPNLRFLDAHLHGMLIDGHQWQHLIRTYLPRLRTPIFAMRRNSIGADQVEPVVNTFRTPFWTEEHRWFVRGLFFGDYLEVYTIAKTYSYSYSSLPTPHLFTSTDPHDSIPRMYQQLTSAQCRPFDEHRLPADVQLPRVTRLALDLPVDEHFWNIHPPFEQLTRLQTILDRASRLHNLTLDFAESEPIDTLLSLRVTTPIANFVIFGPRFNDNECYTLSRSPLARLCHALALSVDNRESVLILARNLPELRMLNLSVQHGDEPMVQYLQSQLLPSCLVSTTAEYAHCLHIWLS